MNSLQTATLSMILGGFVTMTTLVWIIDSDSSRFVRKSALDKKQTIVHNKQYVQYSAVRRIPIPDKGSVSK